MGGVTLRRATVDDAERLFEWVNDPETRRQSFTSDPVPWDAHVAWLGRVLDDPDRRLFVIVVDGEPVGRVRLDRGDGHELLSISVAPSARGRGLAVEAIRAACDLADAPIVAEVKATNEASLRAFRRAGLEEHADGDVVTFRRESG